MFTACLSLPAKILLFGSQIHNTNLYYHRRVNNQLLCLSSLTSLTDSHPTDRATNNNKDSTNLSIADSFDNLIKL